MTYVPSQRLQANGTKPTQAAPTTSDTYDCGPGIFLVVTIGATATTVTVIDPRVTENGTAIPDLVAVSAGTAVERWIPLPSYYAGIDGKANVTFSQVANVTAAAVSVI